MSDRQQIVDETRTARAKAQDLLRALVETKASTDPKGKGGDLYKRVTGQSSIEAAIASTKRMVETYDRMLVQLETRSPALIR